MSNTCACCLRGLVFLAVVDYVASELPSPPVQILFVGGYRAKSKPAPAPVQPAPLQRLTSAYDFDVPFRGEPADIKPFLGKANIFVNVKFDDPESTQQMPGLQDLVSKYASEGLHVLAFPTDQGWFEADDSNTLRIKFKQVYNFGQYPTAVVRRLPF